MSDKAAAALPEGLHTEKLNMADRKGDQSEATWEFDTRSGPEVGLHSPKDVELVASDTVIDSTQYSDTGGSIYAAKTLLTLNGADLDAMKVMP